jgi:5-oxoprolinase (ATP-hydrolysing)
MVPDFFPSIFGPHANEPLDVDIVKRKFKEMTIEINKDFDVKLTEEDVALGFIKMANETMARPIRNITEDQRFRNQRS